MKEFIEKLIEKMQGVFCDGCTSCRGNQCDGVDKEECSWMVKIKESINELAEEFGKDTNVTTKDDWIPCSERLPEANQKVLTCDKDGWISVNVNMPYIGVRNDFECGYYVAWMPLPAPYKENENGKI